MSEATDKVRESLNHTLDMLEMAAFNQGFEAAINAIDEMSNELHNTGDIVAAEVLRWLSKEMAGENA